MIVSRRRLALVLAVAASLAIGVAACGDDEDAASGTAKLNMAEFLEQANAGCERERKGIEERVATFMDGQPPGKPRIEVSSDLVYFVLLPTVENELEAIRALRWPAEQEQEIREVLASEQLVIDKLATTQRIASREAMDREFAESGRTLREYGLSACANGP